MIVACLMKALTIRIVAGDLVLHPHNQFRPQIVGYRLEAPVVDEGVREVHEVGVPGVVALEQRPAVKTSPNV